MTIAPLFFRPSLEWELLPDDYPLPDDPVDNTTQPLLAEALRESLDLADLLPPLGFVATNLGICTKVAGQFVVKAPDWVYVPQTAQRLDQRRSYTPEREGSLPLLVLEFLSETEGGEYSLDPNYPYGKWYFYERIPQVPLYGIFNPQTGHLDLFRLQEG
ncbi:MAG: Uma2 family endonuclease, partial [Microcystaceae cyanobacterium]